MKEQIHIALNIDSNYVKHCAVTLASLFANNKEECFVVHILENGLTHEHKELLRSIVAKANSEVMFYEPEASLLSGLSIRKFSKRISMATYYRCLLSEIIPQEVDKLLYLDCDIVIMDSIRPLWELSLEGVGVAAVEDVGYDEHSVMTFSNTPRKTPISTLACYSSTWIIGVGTTWLMLASTILTPTPSVFCLTIKTCSTAFCTRTSFSLT